MRTVKRYRTLFISDIHLGTKACQAELVLDFLKHSEADTYYLVGDVVDFWRIGCRACRAHALRYSWSDCARLFIDNIVTAGDAIGR